MNNKKFITLFIILFATAISASAQKDPDKVLHYYGDIAYVKEDGSLQPLKLERLQLLDTGEIFIVGASSNTKIVSSGPIRLIVKLPEGKRPEFCLSIYKTAIIEGLRVVKQINEYTCQPYSTGFSELTLNQLGVGEYVIYYSADSVNTTLSTSWGSTFSIIKGK